MSKEICPKCGQVIHKKHFVPPTLEEINAYIKENNLNVNGGVFYKYFTAAEPKWVDSESKPVRNWKQKLLTWSSKSNGTGVISSKIRLFPIAGKICSKCPLPAVYKDSAGSYDHYYCLDHSPPEVREKYS